MTKARCEMTKARASTRGFARQQREGHAIEKEIGEAELKALWKDRVPPDAWLTNLNFGPPSVTPFRDPHAQARARRMLCWIPTCQQFAGILDEEEAAAWNMSFCTVVPQRIIALEFGASQGAISKLRSRCVQKLNERFRQLREANKLPVEILAWLKTYVGDASQDLCFAVNLLRRRDRALQKGLRGRDASTGCPKMDGLSLRKAV